MNADEQNWRNKYREALKQLAADEARAQRLESVLRLLIGRLCLAGQGRDAQLDAELSRVAAVVRKASDADQLEELIGPLSQAVAVLDSGQPTHIPPPSPDTATLPVLDRLALLPELQDVVKELRARGDESLSTQDLVDLLHRVARLASEQRGIVQRERLELGDLLQQTTARLDEIESHLANELAERSSAHDDTTKLNLLVSGEVEQIHADAHRTEDIAVMRKALGARLNTISMHVREFNVREETRTSTYRERTQRMRTRIAALERESRNLHKTLKQEHRQAMLDALTGIPNRAAYDDRVGQEYKRWKRFGRPVSLLAWDVDSFKGINDAFGHKAGDKVLRIIGQQLVRNVRDTDFVARYGGDEFVMLLVGSSTAEAAEVAEKIRGEVAALGFHFHDKPVQVTLSCGITSFAGDEGPDAAFDCADRALYEAKKAGKNRCAVK
jgi:diguanylate cyclase